MSFGDPSQTELREMSDNPHHPGSPDTDPQVDPRAPEPDVVPYNMQLSGVDANLVNVPSYAPGFVPFGEEDIYWLALAMKTQGSFFLGIDVRSDEGAHKCARDVFILFDTMLYGKPIYDTFRDGPLRPPNIPGPPS